MIKSNCYNCVHFKETNERKLYFSESVYECLLHKDKARISYPNEQFCKDVDTNHIIINKRNDVLNELGI